MTLDPVHVDGIADLATEVRAAVDETDQTALAERAFAEFLDPLYDSSGNVVLEPLGEHGKHKVSTADIALTDAPFPTHHGLDAGTINPTTFKNGLVVDVSQAAMAGVPSDIDLHRGRTIVMTVHTNDTAANFEETDWRMDDEGYARRRILRAPRVDRHEQVVVHALALYLAESDHALEQHEVVGDLLVLDGPIYPTGLLKWVERDPELERLIIEREEFTDVIGNYIELVERFVDRGVPLTGFVKNSASKAITRELRRVSGVPWVDDSDFFRRVLERHDGEGELQTDTLTFTGWYRSRAGTDGVLADGTIDLDSERNLDDEAYEVTFFVIYDPRDDLLYRVEAPYAFTRDEQRREALTTQFLGAVARERGPPLAVGKADELARIDRPGKETIRRRIEHAFESDQQTDYNDKRWGPAEWVDH